ncbi:hypothetical protein LWX53_06265 [bacterium]|nr:hypothetical protein [bacterium]
MNRYWFFPATLPGLVFGSKAGMSSSEFLAQCERYLSAADYRETFDAIAALEADETPTSLGSPLLAKFADWERTFRNELSRLRARRAGARENAYARPAGRNDEAGRAAAACFAIEDPYQAELALERERWSAIDRLAPLAAFDLDFIVAYRLKLAINERLALLSAETGAAGYRRLYDDILGGAPRSAETDTLGVQA